MGKREPLTFKQTMLVVFTGACLNMPAMMFFALLGAEYPKKAPMVAAANLLVGVPLLAFISEKWIRKTKD